MSYGKVSYVPFCLWKRSIICSMLMLGLRPKKELMLAPLFCSPYVLKLDFEHHEFSFIFSIKEIADVRCFDFWVIAAGNCIREKSTLMSLRLIEINSLSNCVHRHHLHLKIDLGIRVVIWGLVRLICNLHGLELGIFLTCLFKNFLARSASRISGLVR